MHFNSSILTRGQVFEGKDHHQETIWIARDTEGREGCLNHQKYVFLKRINRNY